MTYGLGSQIIQSPHRKTFTTKDLSASEGQAGTKGSEDEAFDPIPKLGYIEVDQEAGLYHWLAPVSVHTARPVMIVGA